MLGINLGIWSSAYRGSTGMTWTRPSDWLPMPTLVPTDQRLVGLFAVGDHDSNFCALTVTGTGDYVVDWGDGTTPDTVASGVTAYHNYDYAAAALVGSECSRGYRQAIISVTMASGNMTGINLNVKHNQSGLPTGYCVPWLDIALAGSNITTLTIGGTNITKGLLERLNIVSCGAVTNLSYFMQNCYSLQSVTFPAGFGSVATNLASFMQYCTSLQSVTFPAGFGSVATSLANFMYYCYSFQSTTFPAGFGSVATNLASFMYSCTSLQSVTFPAGFGSVATSLANFMYNCYSFQSTTFPAGFGSVATNLASFMQNCTSLQSVTFPAGFGSVATNLASFMQYCTSLQSVTFPAGFGSVATSLASFMQNCTSLQSVTFPAGFGSVATSLASFMQNCYALLEISGLSAPAATMTSFLSSATSIRKASISVAESFTLNACLAADELNALYTALPTVTGKTITCSGNHGFSGSNTSILSGKGWSPA